MNKYDVIVIGSGCAGLGAAARFAKSNKKVLVLEKHNIPGGCGTSFRRGRFEFEVALHQLSQMGSPENPGTLRKLFREYGIEEQIDWIEIRELYNVIQPKANINLSLPADLEGAKKAMIKQFPNEEQQIIKYYDLVWSFSNEYFDLIKKQQQSNGEENISAAKKMMTGKIFSKKYPVLAKYLMKSSQQVLDEIGLSKEAQTCVNVYWSFMGMPPSKLPFAILAACTYLYIVNKPYYLKGGSQVMSQALTEFIRKNGGKVRFNCGVKRILLENNKAVGVITDDDETIKANKIISNISPIHTYVNLLEPYQVPKEALKYLSNCKIGTSAISCFIGLDCPPNEIGMKTSFNLIYPARTSGDSVEPIRKLTAEDDPLVVTCYTIDDPSVSPEGTSIITAIALKYAEPWIELPPEQYYETKYKVANQIVDRVNEQFPGFKEHIEEMEVATPLTHMRYLNHPGGAIYGFEQDLNATGFFFPSESHIENLEFASGWTRLCGFGPNYLNGNTVAKKVLEEA